jgi:hypothetical protein
VNGTTSNPLDGFITTSAYDTENRAWIFAVTLQDIPPSVARLVWRRDGGRCRGDGCRSSRGLELHHVVHRADGGGHDAGNLILLCSACHLAHHRGLLAITGTAERLEIRRLGQMTPAGDRGHQTASTAVNASAGADVRPAKMTAIADGGARAHVDAADRQRANTRPRGRRRY